MTHTILYTSDIHGNEVQYELLFQHATNIAADSIIIGGDIAPKGLRWDKFIQGQRDFLERKLPSLAKEWRERNPTSQLYLMMGNDDVAVNMDVLENSDLFHVIHNKRIVLTPDFDLVGYSCVPITPFGIKDWEKFDFSDVPIEFGDAYVQRKYGNYNLQGYKTDKSGWRPFLFASEERIDSIQIDLAQDIFVKDPRKTIYVVHTPPDNTHLDRTSSAHVGSMALRDFIQRHQPYLTLHGHIHETVDISGQFQDHLGKTLCMSSGNHNVGRQLAVLQFDLYKPEEARRVILKKGFLGG